jgi:NAD(P)H dehydrogenase (quinone)
MISVTAATGKLGHHVVEQLLERVPAAEIALAVRDPDKAEAWKARGVSVRRADYDDPSSFASAFAGVDKLLLISSNAMGQRERQHRAAVEAAKKAGIQLIAYTSIVHAERSTLSLAVEHKLTEQLIRAAAIPFVFLRNSWYFENYTENLGPALAQGTFFGSAGQGRIAAASRADYAAAAVAVLTGDGHENQTYELGGDHPFTMSELAAEVSRQTGRTIGYTDVPEAQYREALVAAGLAEGYAAALANSDVGISRGELDDGSHTLSRLIGRTTTPLSAAVKAALAKAPLSST